MSDIKLFYLKSLANVCYLWNHSLWKTSSICLFVFYWQDGSNNPSPFDLNFELKFTNTAAPSISQVFHLKSIWTSFYLAIKNSEHLSSSQINSLAGNELFTQAYRLVSPKFNVILVRQVSPIKCPKKLCSKLAKILQRFLRLLKLSILTVRWLIFQR